MELEDTSFLLLLDSTLPELEDSFTFTELEELSILAELEDTSVFDELDDSTFLELEDFSELDGANALSLEDNSVTLLDDSASLTEELDSKSSILLEIVKTVSSFEGALELSSPQAIKPTTAAQKLKAISPLEKEGRKDFFIKFSYRS